MADRVRSDKPSPLFRSNVPSHAPSVSLVAAFYSATVAVVVLSASVRPSMKYICTRQKLLLFTAATIVCTYQVCCCLRPGMNILAAFVCPAFPCRCNYSDGARKANTFQGSAAMCLILLTLLPARVLRSNATSVIPIPAT